MSQNKWVTIQASTTHHSPKTANVSDTHPTGIKLGPRQDTVLIIAALHGGRPVPLRHLEYVGKYLARKFTSSEFCVAGLECLGDKHPQDRVHFLHLKGRGEVAVHVLKEM